MRKLPKVPRWKLFFKTQQILKNPVYFHREIFKKLGHTFTIKTPEGDLAVFTKNAKIIRHVLQKNHSNYKKSTLQTEDLAKYIGKGLLTLEGEHWLVHRRMIQPAFHKKKLELLFDVMHQAIQKELLQIKTNTPFDVHSLMSDLAFQVVAKSLFSSNDIQKEMSRLQYITEANQQMIVREMRQPYLKWWFVLSGLKKKHLAYAKEGSAILNSIIEDRINSETEKNDLLDMLLHATYEDGTFMPRQQLIDEVFILFTAGHETTANTLSFTLLLLAKNPEIQEKLYQEVKQVRITKGYIAEVFSELQYTKACIEEAMRLYPPVYMIDRVAIEEDTVEGCSLTKDTLLLLSIYELHRGEDFWENPSEYIPERFLHTDKKLYAAHYYPFGAGPRMCIGNNFAMYEMMLTLVEIFKKYEVTTTHDTIEINPLISLKPKSFSVSFKKRTNH